MKIVAELEPWRRNLALENLVTIFNSSMVRGHGASVEKQIYISVEDRLETLLLPQDVTGNQIYAFLQQLCHVKDNEATLSLLDSEGRKLSIGSDLPSNTQDNPYRVKIRLRNGMPVEDEVAMEFLGIEKGFAELERRADSSTEICSLVKEMKEKWNKMRSKWDGSSYISGYNLKDAAPSCVKLQVRRLSDTRQKEVRRRFFEICENTLSEDVRQALRLPSFNCSKYEDEEILHILEYMYVDFDLPTKFDLDRNTLRHFLFTVYKNYNDVPFHNFRHSFCVTQMMYAMCKTVNLARDIGDLKILVLLTSCICHDLDHPGYNNMYQINARTELALRYNDISPLENHHCCMAFRIFDLPECSIFSKMSDDLYKTVREGIIRCILATDMARHNEILSEFKGALREGFKFNEESHVNVLCKVLIKVADISNEARPMDVAEPWLDKLLTEFYNQSDKEKEGGLPVTPFMDRDRINKVTSQCNFIGFVLLPLFEALEELFPELTELIVDPVRSALEYYENINAKDKQLRKQSIIASGAYEPKSSASSGPNSPVRPNALKQSNNALDKSLKEDPEGSIFSASSRDSEDYQDDYRDDSQTENESDVVNEAVVSEMSQKFRVATESKIVGSEKKSCPSSRKGSKENHQESELARYCASSLHSSDSGDKIRSWSSSEQHSIDDNRGRQDATKKSSPDEKKETRSLSFVEQRKKEFIFDSSSNFSVKKRSISACSSEELRRKKSIASSKSPELKEEEEESKPFPESPEDSSCTAKKSVLPPTEHKSLDFISSDKDGTSNHKEDSIKYVSCDVASNKITRLEGSSDRSDRSDQDRSSNCSPERAEKNSKSLVQCVNSVKNLDQASAMQNIDITVNEACTPGDVKHKTPSPQSNIMKRLKKSLGDRLSRRSTSSDSSSSKLTVAETVSQPASPASLKTPKMEEAEELERKAMTLPKMLKHKSGKPHRWKILLKPKTDGSASSSVEKLTDAKNRDSIPRRKSSDGEARGTSGSDKIENGLTPPEEDLSAETANNNKTKSKYANINHQKKTPSEAKSQRWMSTLMASFRLKKSNNS